MKTKNLFISLISGVLMITACLNNTEEHETIKTPTFGETDCLYSAGFVDSYREFIDKDYVFLIRGITQNVVSGYGRKIKVVEDLKGNFKEGSSIILWGAGGGSGEPVNESPVNLSQYAENETLIILMDKRMCMSDDGIEREYYCTTGCGYSVLSLSNEQVTGIVYSDYKKRTMPWKELQNWLPDNCSQKVGFFDNYKMNMNRDDVFFIKGVTIGYDYHGYGKEIKPIEDLKGNFPKELSSFVLWGAGDISARIDHLQSNTERDTLIMLIKPVISVDYPYTEQETGNFTTIDCAYSTLYVEDGGVRGQSVGWKSWDEFLTLLKQ